MSLAKDIVARDDHPLRSPPTDDTEAALPGVDDSPLMPSGDPLMLGKSSLFEPVDRIVQSSQSAPNSPANSRKNKLQRCSICGAPPCPPPLPSPLRLPPRLLLSTPRVSPPSRHPLARAGTLGHKSRTCDKVGTEFPAPAPTVRSAARTASAGSEEGRQAGGSGGGEKPPAVSSMVPSARAVAAASPARSPLLASSPVGDASPSPPSPGHVIASSAFGGGVASGAGLAPQVLVAQRVLTGEHPTAPVAAQAIPVGVDM